MSATEITTHPKGDLSLIEWLDSNLVPTKLKELVKFEELRETLRENGGDFGAACATVGVSNAEAAHLSSVTALIDAGYKTYASSGGSEMLCDAVIDGLAHRSMKKE